MSFEEKDILSKKKEDLIEAKIKLSKAKTAKDKEMLEARISILEESIKKRVSIARLTTNKALFFTVVIPIVVLVIAGIAFLIEYMV